MAAGTKHKKHVLNLHPFGGNNSEEDDYDDSDVTRRGSELLTAKDIFRQRHTSVIPKTQLKRRGSKSASGRGKAVSKAKNDAVDKSSIREKISKALTSNIIYTCTFASVMWALFAQDVCLGWLSKEADSVFSSITWVVLVYLTIEFSLHCAFSHNYICSHFFWIDFIGTAMLIPDIMEYANDSYFSAKDTSGSVWQVARAGRVARSASMLRVGRLLRIIRILRVYSRSARIMRFIHKFQFGEVISNATLSEMSHTETASKDAAGFVRAGVDASPTIFGLRHANRTSQRVVMGVLLILAVAPQFFFCEYNFSRESNFEYLDQWGRTACNSSGVYTSYQDACDEAFARGVNWYLQHHTDVLHMIVNNYTLHSKEGAMDLLRKSAITYSVSDTSLIVNGEPDGVVYFNDADKETGFRLSNIMTTLFVVFIFAAGSYIFNQDARTSIIEPIQRLTGIIKTLAARLLVLSSDEDETFQDMYGDDFIEKIAEKLAGVFDGKKDKSETVDPSTRDLGGTSSVYADGDEEDESGLFEEAHHVALNEELSTLANCLKNDNARAYFRMFLSREFNVENIAFWELAENFREITDAKAQLIYRVYISQRGESQVNIPSTMRTEIRLQLDDPARGMFNAAHEEIFRLMKTDPYPRFLKSEICREYINKRTVAET